MAHAVARTPAALARASPVATSGRARLSRTTAFPRRAPARGAPARAFASLDQASLVADVAGDVFAETGLGPALCVAGTVWVGYVVTNGYSTIKRLKEELTAEGYDVEEFNKVGELKAIRRAVDDGTVDGIFDKVWYQRAVMSVGSGSIVDVQKTQAYWRKRGVNVKTLADLDKITAYMVKKYGKDAKMSG
jgi:hypothetical protein